jgi:short-subunit dehydrogenase
MTRPATLITGASAGIGVEFARLCAARGDSLVLVARRRERLESLAAELGGGLVIAADLADPASPERIVREVELAGFHVETLVNNAGFGKVGNCARLPLEPQLEMIDVNVRALVELTRRLLPGMIARREGGILNVASTAAFQPGPGYGVYFASKAFVLSLSEALHHELEGSGVHLSCLCPGPTESEFSQVARGRPSGSRLRASARAVAAAGLRGLQRNQAIVVPGFGNKITSQMSRFLPRAIMRRIVARVKG